MPTSLEIVDSAVKIGLGALITAVAAAWTSKRGHRHELEKLAIEDRRSLLRSAAGLLEQATAAANRATYILAHAPDGKRDTESMFVDAINKLNEARSLAVLAAARALADDIAALRSSFEGITGYLLESGDNYSISECNKRIARLNEIWPRIYAELERSYTSRPRDV